MEIKNKITKILIISLIILGFCITWWIVLFIFNVFLLSLICYISNKQADNYLKYFSGTINKTMRENNNEEII